MDDVGTKPFTLELTKDELTILRYVMDITTSAWGDPLKDTYELGKDEPDDPYAVQATLRGKVHQLRWGGNRG
jgi:hypothetical protein